MLVLVLVVVALLNAAATAAAASSPLKRRGPNTHTHVRTCGGMSEDVSRSSEKNGRPMSIDFQIE